MRQVASLATALIVTCALCAAAQSPKDDPNLQSAQLGIFVSGKGWDTAYFTLGSDSKQTVTLRTPNSEAITGFKIIIPKATLGADLKYTCFYKDSLLGNDKTQIVASDACPSTSHNTQSLYLEGLSVEPTDKITLSCWSNCSSVPEPDPSVCAKPSSDSPYCIGTKTVKWITGIKISYSPK